MPESMNIVFFGSAPIAVSALDALVASRLNVIAVFSQPDRPAGRGGRMQMTAVKERALALGLPVFTPDHPKDQEAVRVLEEFAPDVAVVVAYGHLIPKSLLDIPAYGFINLHASILPKYRGAAPVPHAILNGEQETGVTVFRLNERFDAGDILAIERIPITPEDTSASVLAKLAPLGAELVCKVIGEFAAGWAHPVAQSEEQATRAPKMHKEDGLLDWKEAPAIIDRKVRAYQPWPLCFTFLGEGKKRRRLNILRVAGAADVGVRGVPGEVLLARPREGEGLVVACGEGRAVRILRLQPEGKREMAAEEYLRGAGLVEGTILG